MAGVALITAHDDFAMGLRMMAGCLRRNGQQVKVILFRSEQQIIMEEPLSDPVIYPYYLAEELRGIAYDVSP